MITSIASHTDPPVQVESSPQRQALCHQTECGGNAVSDSRVRPSGYEPDDNRRDSCDVAAQAFRRRSGDTIDRNGQSCTAVTHARIRKRSELFRQRADANVLDGIDVDRVRLRLEVHGCSSCMGHEGPSEPQDCSIPGDHDNRTRWDLSEFTPPQVVVGGQVHHDDVAASWKEARSLRFEGGSNRLEVVRCITRIDLRSRISGEQCSDSLIDQRGIVDTGMCLPRVLEKLLTSIARSSPEAPYRSWALRPPTPRRNRKREIGLRWLPGRMVRCHGDRPRRRRRRLSAA